MTNEKTAKFPGFRGKSGGNGVSRRKNIAESGSFGNKKTERSQTLSRRFGQEPAPIMPENVRQDVETQSHRIYFILMGANDLFYLADFRDIR